MKTTSEYLQLLKQFKDTKGIAYGIKKIGLFGSVARGEHKDGSDVDVCFEGVPQGFASQHPGLKKVIRNLQYTFCYWTSVAGDMSQEKADELLDDISTDGKRIDSEKIAQLVKRIQPIVISKGMELSPSEGLRQIEKG